MSPRELIGLIPAGGKAVRLGPLPCSKELYPIGFKWSEHSRRLHPKPVCLYLLEKMRFSGVENAYVVLRKGKWDIPAFLADGRMLDMHLAYLMIDLTHGVPFTLDQAYPFVQRATIVFGFPDILFSPDDAFLKLLSRQEASNADIVLGLFPVLRPGSMDMVELDRDGRICELHIKPGGTHLSYTWIIAAWAPSFTQFIHEYVAAVLREYDIGEKNRELCLSEVINAAIKRNIEVDYVIFDEGHCLDIGTPDNLVKALRLATTEDWP